MFEKKVKVNSEDFRKREYNGFVLAGDIGGTNTNLAIMGYTDKKMTYIFSLHFKSQKIKDLIEPINTILKVAKDEYDIEISKSCLAVAGPINPEKNYCKLTNTKFSVDANKILKNTLLGSFSLINDFEAIGYGIEFLDKNNENDIIQLPHPKNCFPKPAKKGTIVVVGAGTGLGKCIVVYDRNRLKYITLPSEGGHADFAPDNDIEWELMNFFKKNILKTKHHPSYDKILSGFGIEGIYSFFKYKKMFPSTKFTKEIDSSENKPTLISKHSKKDKTCAKVIDVFIRIYARFARNAALDPLSFEGLYVAGGIASKNIEKFKEGTFMKIFENNISMKEILKKIPVFVIMNYDASLYGAANVAVNFPEMAHSK